MPRTFFAPVRRSILAGALIFMASVTAADEGSPRATVEVIRSHLAPNTATLGATSLNLPGSYLRNDTAAYSVEANISPSFTVFTGRTEGALTGTWMFTLVPQFVIRRSDGIPSNPVRTPSYIPQATLFYAPRDSAAADGSLWYSSVTLLHYSNGQAGPFLREDGTTLNNVDGSFSLWSVAATFHYVSDWPLLPAYKAIRVAYLYNKEGLLDALYPDYTLSLSLQTRERRHAGLKRLGALGGLGGRTQWRADVEWLVPTRNSLPASQKPSPFAGSLMAIYSPEWGSKGSGQGSSRAARFVSGFSLFGRFYAGYDPYNMNFNREIYRIDGGLMFRPF